MRTAHVFVVATCAAALVVPALPAEAQYARGRSGAIVAPRGGFGPRVGAAVPRSVFSRPFVPRPFFGHPFFGLPFFGPPFFRRPFFGPTFFRPFVSFRPRVFLGFGLWAGYPVPYPHWYYPYPYYHPYAYPPYPYPYPYPNPYPAPTSGYSAPSGQPSYANLQASTGRAPPNAATGAVNFDITPSGAGVYVDGHYAGRVGNFTRQSEPLTLAAGHHHIDVRAPGYHTMSFDTKILAGQVIPYQGKMQVVR